MVKHIVLFKLKDEVPAEEKLVVMTKFKEAIEALPAKISLVRASPKRFISKLVKWLSLKESLLYVIKSYAI